jgi:hypothetical protein
LPFGPEVLDRLLKAIAEEKRRRAGKDDVDLVHIVNKPSGSGE